jgi:4-methyl-5(b-hydroxyethyl)-thiazole monophosphate biosynthesis
LLRVVTDSFVACCRKADGTEEIEAIAVADVLTRGGMKVTLASVGRKMQNIVTMSQGTKVQGDIAIEACADLSFDLIVCPGVRLCLHR